MNLLLEFKRTYQIVSYFMERMDHIEEGCRSHLESLKTAKKKDKKKVEARFKNFVDSLRTKQYENQTQEISKNSGIPKTSSHCEPEEPTDDEFLWGPVRQKPKKPLCLSIKKSSKKQSKPIMERRLLDTVPEKEQVVPNTIRTPSDTREEENLDDQTRISISWTIKIKESSAQRTNQVKITGTERVNLETPRLSKPLSDRQTSFVDSQKLQRLESNSTYEHEDEEETLQTAEQPKHTETCDRGNEDIKNTSNNFRECRVVVRKLSTSHEIFQPKVVLRKLTDDEISKIYGISCHKPTLSMTGPSEPTVRYTSLILEPARKFPRMFSTVKMRCSVMKLVLTPPQVRKEPHTIKTAESSNDMVKSMFKTKSKCLKEWRTTRTKDVPRKSMELRQDEHIGAANTDKLSNTKHIQGLRPKSRTKEIQEFKPKYALQQRKFKSMTSPKSDVGQDNQLPIQIHESQNTCDKLEQELGNANEGKEFKIKEMTYKTYLPKHDLESNLRKPGNIEVTKPEKIDDATCSRDEDDSIRELKLCKDKIEETKRQITSNQKHTTNKSPKKIVLITPTKLKYSIKTRSKGVQNSQIQDGRVTRSRIEIQHSGTNSASRLKSGNIFPGSQLTFLIESFRR